MSMIEERRTATLLDAAMKGRVFRGLAAVFDQPWDKKLTDQYGYEEIVKRGAFRKALASGDNIPFLLEHDPKQMLATTGGGNLHLSEDAKGLVVEARLPDDYLGEYARNRIEAGDMRGMSYGLQLNRQTDQKMLRIANALPKLLIVGAKRLLDVSLTYSPAYPDTAVDLRSKPFVAHSLEERLGGTETQAESAPPSESPDAEPEAWWGETPTEAEEVPEAEEPIPYWERLARQIEEMN